MLDALEDAFELLAATPEIGHKRDDLTARPVKFWPVYLDEALPLLRQATELEPAHAAYWAELGKLLMQMNRPTDAREALDRDMVLVRSRRERQLLQAFLREITFGCDN